MSFPTRKEIEEEEISDRVAEVVIDAAWEGCLTKKELLGIIISTATDAVNELLNEDGTLKNQK